MNRSRLALALVLQTVILGGFFWPSPARAGWGSGGCGPVGPTVQAERWTFHQGRWYLYRGNVQVAGYDPDAQVYRTYDARTNSWGEAQSPPWAVVKSAKQHKEGCICPDCPEGGPCADGCPCGRQVGQLPGGQIEQNFGVDRSKIHTDNRYTLGGQPSHKRQAEQALGDVSANVPDDSGKPRLTVIGSDQDRKRVLDDVAKAPWRDSILVQDYAPTEWATRPGFVTGGHPTIYLQAPDGKVLLRQDEYQPERLAEAVRKSSPDYDPKKDPNGSPSLPNIDWSQAEQYAPLGVLGVLALIAGAANLKRKS